MAHVIKGKEQSMRSDGGALRKEKEPSAEELLRERLESLINEASENMTEQQFKKAADGADVIIERARARAARREKA